LLYERYKKDQLFDPTLRGDVSYREAYEQLNHWFSKNFIKYLLQRLQTLTVSKQVSLEHVKQYKNDFQGFLNILRALKIGSFSDHDRYVGFADFHPISLLFKKILHNLHSDPTIIDTISDFFDPGSALYMIELYSSLIGEQLFDEFQEYITHLTDDQVHQLISQPQLLLNPWNHQQKAFEEWLKHNGVGSIEMATATGKTLVGMMAIKKLVHEKDDVNVRIITHSKAILNQWRREIIEKLGIPDNPLLDYHTGIRSNGLQISFHTVQGVYRQFVYKSEKYSCDLAIFDEVHHEAARTYRYALEIDAKQKMGLSATINDVRANRIERYLGGPVVFRYSFKEALADGIIPQFDWKLHISPLSLDENYEYTQVSKQIVKRFNYVKQDHETIQRITGGKKVQIRTLGDFIGLVQLASFKGVKLPENWKILQTQLLRRRWIIHRSKPKISEAVTLARKYGMIKKTILFTMDIDTCEQIADELRKESIPVFLVHSKFKNSLSQLSNFKKQKNGVLIGARMLEEGIDIPDAEIGINVSSSKTRLQLVQRMGRILRYKEGKKPVFHHFVGIPVDYFDDEDDIKVLDDISWVQDAALKMGVSAEVEASSKVHIDAERSIQQRYDKEQKGTIPKLGTFRLEKVLSSMPEESINAIISCLKEYNDDYIIKDTEWNGIIRTAHHREKHGSVVLPGHWWLLIFGKRKPKNIIELLESKAI